MCIPIETAELLEKRIDNAYLAFYQYGKRDQTFGPFQQPFFHAKANQCLKNNLSIVRKGYLLGLDVSVKMDDKLVIGTGGHQAYSSNVGMTLHPLYGVPYVPSSAIKGLLRHVFLHEMCGEALAEVMQEKKDERQTDEQFVEAVLKNVSAETRQCYVDWFGIGSGTIEETGQQGSLIFLDGVIEGSNVYKDVITPHYVDYYTTFGKNAPTDDQSPNIIQMSSLKKVSVQFSIATSDELTKERTEALRKLIRLAFEEYGIGAKTSIGYGVGKVKIKEKEGATT